MNRINRIFLMGLIILIFAASSAPEALGGPFRRLHRRHSCPTYYSPPCKTCGAAGGGAAGVRAASAKIDCQPGEVKVCVDICLFEFWDLPGEGEPAMCISAIYELANCAGGGGNDTYSGACRLVGNCNPGQGEEEGDCFCVPASTGVKRHFVQGQLMEHTPTLNVDLKRKGRANYRSQRIGDVHFNVRNADGVNEQRFARIYWIWCASEEKNLGFGVGVQLPSGTDGAQPAIPLRVSRTHASIMANVDVGTPQDPNVQRKIFAVRFFAEATPTPIAPE